MVDPQPTGSTETAEAARACAEALGDDGWRAFPHTFAERCSAGKWIAYRHLEYVAEAVAMAVIRGNGRLIINMPPGHGKSKFLSVWTPTWFIDNFPELAVVMCTHGAEFTAEFGRQVRNQFAANPLLRSKLSRDSKSADQWNTTEGGGMVTGGVGTGITGRRGHLLLLDDPYPDYRSAHSSTYRRHLEDWWRSVFTTRAEPNATMVVLHHRWHPKDLTWFLVEQEQSERWQHIRLPAIAEPGDPIGRAPGEALCPERFPIPALERIRAREAGGAHTWNAMYQQNPRAAVGGAVYGRFGQWNLEPGAALIDGLPLCVTFDFNIHPGMHALVGQYDPKHDLFGVRHEIHEWRMSLYDCLDRLHALLGSISPGKFRWPELHVFGDSSGRAGTISAGDSHYDQISRRLERAKIPFRLRVPGAAPALVDSIMAVNDALRDGEDNPHVRVHPSCVRLLADFSELLATENGLIEKSDKALSHASDAFRYWCAYLRPAGGPIHIGRGRFSVTVV